MDVNRELEQAAKQRLEMLRIIGVLVERAGGEVTITRSELAPDRVVDRESIGIGIVVRAQRAPK